ncbi:unnamed protein product [Clonostachys byssicola]|uniref:Uncharacterized protein n=1 Tax=Clonostachys byssicola TaxID=160290 RepID=A0A9N9Y7A3_9HYPO|nr:unnamed protein product [Clonostachys byssicola]
MSINLLVSLAIRSILFCRFLLSLFPLFLVSPIRGQTPLPHSLPFLFCLASSYLSPRPLHSSPSLLPSASITKFSSSLGPPPHFQLDHRPSPPSVHLL